jgi:hypothetical protein
MNEDHQLAVEKPAGRIWGKTVLRSNGANRPRQTRSTYVHGRLFLLSFTILCLAFVHHTALVLSIGNLIMQSQLDDGRELRSSESDGQATEDEDYYMSFVTFEVKGKAKSSSISNTMIG